jgi:hypothetical protein
MQVAALSGSVGSLAGFARSEAAVAPVPVAQEQPRDAYFSPVFKFDKAARVVVFQFRDGETGDVTRQYPSEKVVKLYRDGASIQTGARGDESAAPDQSGTAEKSAAPLPKAQPIASSTAGAAEAGSTPSGAASERVSLTA